MRLVRRYEGAGIDVGLRACERCSRVAEDFALVRGESAWTMSFGRPGWDVQVETHTVLTSDKDAFVTTSAAGAPGHRPSRPAQRSVRWLPLAPCRPIREFLWAYVRVLSDF
ncbi:hypothetical protein C6W96_01375 [Streptomyces sp. CS149]|nr:hypothetical protein C6W96_01375 [Streptomyces sp. CS149]